MLIVAFSSFTSAQQPSGTPKPARETDKDLSPLAGTWVVDDVSLGKNKQSQTVRVWYSQLTITGNTFTLSKYMDLGKEVKGTIVLDPAKFGAVDLKIQEFDMSELGMKLKIPAGTLQAIYSLKEDELTLCFPASFEDKRPTSFDDANNIYKARLIRAPAQFKAFPKEIELNVLGPDDKPAVGVTVAGFMSRTIDHEKKGEIPAWQYSQSAKTDQAGTVRLKYSDCRGGVLLVRDLENKRMALLSLTPANLLQGKVKARLLPECHVTGRIVSEELAKLGRPVDWSGGYLRIDGKRVAFYSSNDGKLEFFAPPGTYSIWAYGTEIESKTFTITVPPDRSELVLDPIAIPATALALLKGQLAPELIDVSGWKGKPFKLSDFKGEYVLLEFWGYWCGPCVGSMPVLIELHEKYAHKGLAIVGVHMDIGGEVDTAEKLDEKIAGHKKELWKGKEIPFPNALVSGKRTGDRQRPGGAIAQYGIEGFPTCILIDREGKVVDQFHARDIKKASEEIEKLLNKK
jgi:uncharacterized protein (TIGR03067 family)